MQNFDLAIETYTKLTDNSRKDKFTCAVLKAHLLALYGKIQLADDLGETDLAADVEEDAEELLEQAAECDPEFDTSTTARLFAGVEGFIPSLTIDSTTYYTEMKAQFQQWKTLPLAEKEIEANRLFEFISAMTNPRDPEEFERLIGPEKRLLEEALARGFEEGLASATDGGVYDPNAF